MTEAASVNINVPRRNRFKRAVPPMLATLPIALFWAAACALACTIMLLYFRGWAWSAQTLNVVMFYAAGAALAVFPAIYIARLLTRKSSALRLIIFMIVLTLATLLFTAVIFAIEYRIYFSQWHGAAFSKLWIWQQAWTAAGAVYTYVVLGLRLYIPVALLALFVTSWWVNRLPD